MAVHVAVDESFQKLLFSFTFLCCGHVATVSAATMIANFCIEYTRRVRDLILLAV